MNIFEFLIFLLVTASVGALLGGLIGGIFAQIEYSIRNQSITLSILFVLLALSVRNLWLPAAADIHPE